MNFDKKQIKEISDLVYRNFGIHITQEKLSHLEPKLEKMIRNEGYSGIDELYKHLMSGDWKCLDTLVRYITTCHTFFFREPDHFRQLVSFVKGRPQTTHRIWCAACSTGEEPYSIVMSLLDAGIRNFHIVASDLNRKVLEQFNRGVYHVNRLDQIPPEILLRYFTRIGEVYYETDQKLRNYISIKNLNLMDSIRFPEQVDYVFCRNVLIYFNEDSRKRTIENITANMKIGGILFIGHAEVLLWQPENLKKIGNSIYQKTC